MPLQQVQRLHVIFRINLLSYELMENQQHMETVQI